MKRPALAYEITVVLVVLFTIGVLFAVLNPIWNEIMSIGITQLDMPTDMANTLNTVWSLYPLFTVLALIVFIILVAMRRQPGGEYT